MEYDFDVIVIGSGFGGSVMTCRLAEKNYKVCLLERGKEYGMYDFPKRINDVKNNIFWDPEDNKFGHMEFRDYPESDQMSVTGSGLGGGSLIYANVLYRMPKEYFQSWPKPYTREFLDKYYDRVLDMMECSPYPYGKDSYYTDTPKTKAMMDVANELEAAEDAIAKPVYEQPHLAIRFEGSFPGEQMKNKHGAIQSKCNKCGDCDIGCNIKAKNTLDLNYIYRARYNLENKAEVRTLAEVDIIKPISEGGYQVEYINPKDHSQRTVLRSKKVVISAGSIHSTALILKMKKLGHLNPTSPLLGKRWCGNGDLLGGVVFTDKHLDPTNGPVITGAIRYQYKDYPDGFPHGFYIEDAGIPMGLSWFLAGKEPSPKSFFSTISLSMRYIKDYLAEKLPFLNSSTELNVGDDIARIIDSDEGIRESYVLLGMGRDRSDGEIQLRDSDNKAVVKWDIKGSQLHYDRLRFEMKRIAEKLGGTYIDNPLTNLDKIIAVHPLGGCIIGENEKEAVVNTKAELFGHKDLYVVDGSIIPTSIGPNPSLTIAAMAEHIAEQF